MVDPIICIFLAILISCLLFVAFEFYPRGFTFVDSLIGAKEYNRMEFQVDSAATCRTACKADPRCQATEFIFDYGGSGSNACVFYSKFSSTLGSTRAPTDEATGVWIKS